MLTQYIKSAMKQAVYEIIEDDKSYYGEIPVCQGVYANTKNLESCRDELEEVLEEWVLFRISRNLPLPVIEGMELKIREVA